MLSSKIPQDIVDRHGGEIHRGLCPKCQGNGPIDVHTSYRVYSLFLYTSRSSKPNICCRSCGIRSQIGDAIFSFLFGWWGFPWVANLFLVTTLCRRVSTLLRHLASGNEHTRGLAQMTKNRSSSSRQCQFRASHPSSSNLGSYNTDWGQQEYHRVIYLFLEGDLCCIPSTLWHSLG